MYTNEIKFKLIAIFVFKDNLMGRNDLNTQYKKILPTGYNKFERN